MTTALQIDNVVSYSDDDKVVTIDNAFGFGAEIGKVEIETPFINYVGVGENIHVMEFKTYNFKEIYENFNCLNTYFRL